MISGSETALHLDKIWTGTRSLLSPFLISNSSFLVLTNAFQKGCVLACSTAGSSAAERMKRENTELFYHWPNRQSIVAHQSD